jgi:hypothetical protein
MLCLPTHTFAFVLAGFCSMVQTGVMGRSTGACQHWLNA